MTTTTQTTEIYFTTTKNGQPRAYRVSRLQFRSFPISHDTAKVMIATGKAVNIGSPFWKMGR